MNERQLNHFYINQVSQAAVLLFFVIFLMPFAVASDAEAVSSYFTGMEKMQKGNTVEALQHYTETINQAPKSVFALKSHWEIAWYNYFNGDYESAKPHFEIMANLPPELEEYRLGRLGLGLLSFQEKETTAIDDNIQYFESILQSQNSQQIKGLALLGLGLDALRFNDFGKALEYAGEVILRGNSDRILLLAHHLAGLSYLHRYDYVESINNFQKCVFYARQSYPYLERRYLNASSWIFKMFISKNPRFINNKVLDLRKTSVKKIKTHRFDANGHIIVMDEGGTFVRFDKEKHPNILHHQAAHPQSLNDGYLHNRLYVFQGEVLDDYGKAQLNLPKKMKLIDAAWGTPGNYWLLDSKTNSIIRTNRKGKILTKIKGLKVSKYDKIASDPFGGMWYFCWQDKNILNYDVYGEQLNSISINFDNNKIKRIDDFVIGNMGFLYLLDSQSKSISVLDRSGNLLKILRFDSLLAPVKEPVAIDFSPEFRFSVSDKKGNAIYEIY